VRVRSPDIDILFVQCISRKGQSQTDQTVAEEGEIHTGFLHVWEYVDCFSMKYGMSLCGASVEVREVSKNSSYFDLSSLPPYLSVPIQHLRNVNYQVAIWKRGDVAEPSLLRL